MTAKTEVIWDGEDLNIPGHGEVKKGDKKLLPVDLAKSFVKQQLAKWPSTSSATNSTSKEKS